jgi:ribosome-associated heat shock protein Hsp15
MNKTVHDTEIITEVRLDIWLWAARFYKTRSLAKSAIEASRVEVNGQTAKPSRMLRVGDQLKVDRASEIFLVQVNALAEQRGSASVAQTLYAESEESKQARQTERERKRFEALGYRAPETKPDKRARRLLRALGDLDMS